MYLFNRRHPECGTGVGRSNLCHFTIGAGIFYTSAALCTFCWQSILWWCLPSGSHSGSDHYKTHRITNRSAQGTWHHSLSVSWPGYSFCSYQNRFYHLPIRSFRRDIPDGCQLFDADAGRELLNHRNVCRKALLPFPLPLWSWTITRFPWPPLTQPKSWTTDSTLPPLTRLLDTADNL